MSQQIGRYRVTGELGRGGMGVVFAVEPMGPPAPPGPLALKLLLSATPQQVDRFRREADALRFLSRHPGVVTLRDLGLHEGQPYLVMDRVEGSSLERRLRQGDLPRAAALGLLVDVARALHFAHEAGFVHRDVKPGNVLLTDEGRALVADFGVVRDQTAEALTRTGELVGTLAYMAPEQADGRRDEIDRRTDVYALGAMLYEVLTGRRPFEGAQTEILYALFEEPPRPPRELAPDVDPAVEAVCLRALAKDPAGRQPTAEDFARALEAALGPDEIAQDGAPSGAGQPTAGLAGGRPVAAPRPRGAARAVAAPVAVGLLAFGLSLAFGRPADVVSGPSKAPTPEPSAPPAPAAPGARAFEAAFAAGAHEDAARALRDAPAGAPWAATGWRVLVADLVAGGAREQAARAAIEASASLAAGAPDAAVELATRGLEAHALAAAEACAGEAGAAVVVALTGTATRLLGRQGLTPERVARARRLLFTARLLAPAADLRRPFARLVDLGTDAADPATGALVRAARPWARDVPPQLVAALDEALARPLEPAAILALVVCNDPGLTRAPEPCRRLHRAQNMVYQRQDFDAWLLLARPEASWVWVDLGKSSALDPALGALAGRVGADLEGSAEAQYQAVLRLLAVGRWDEAVQRARAAVACPPAKWSLSGGVPARNEWHDVLLGHALCVRRGPGDLEEARAVLAPLATRDDATGLQARRSLAAASGEGGAAVVREAW